MGSQPRPLKKKSLLDCDVTKVVHDVNETGSNCNVIEKCKKKTLLENFLKIHLKKKETRLDF